MLGKLTTLYAGIFGAFILLSIGNAGLRVNTTYADCDMPGSNHGNWNPSEKKGEKLLESGASACEIAQKCDSGKIDIDIEDKAELHDLAMYYNANDDVQKKLDHAVEEGHGADGVYCYEVEDIFNN